MDNNKVYEVLAEIHKQLEHIAHSLNDLARVARAEHPEAFKKRLPEQRHPARSPAPMDRS